MYVLYMPDNAVASCLKNTDFLGCLWNLPNCFYVRVHSDEMNPFSEY